MNIKKSKKSYNLEYIEKLFKVIPLVFIFIITIVSVLIAYFILQAKEKRDIDLLIQNKKIHFQFEKKEKLQNFVTSISKNVAAELNILKTEIKKSTYRIIGNLDLLVKSENEVKNINDFLKLYEKRFDISVTIFDKNSLKIVYGKQNVSYLEDLIFGIKNEKYKNLVLKYISSQGKNNLQSWNNDLKGTLRFSFFDTLKVGEKEYYIGSFSKVKNISFLTKNTIVNDIKELKDKTYNIWLFDLVTKESFNYYNNTVFVHSQDIKKESLKKFEILSFYDTQEYENKEYEKLVYFNSLYNYIIVIDYDFKYSINTSLIVSKYNTLLFNIITYILIIGVILTLFSFFFSNFTKNILSRYNKKLQKRTDSLTHWKNRFELAIIASNDGLWDIDFSTNKIYFSNKWLEIAGYQKDEISTFSDWFSLIHNEDKIKVDLLFQEIYNQKSETFISEYRLRTKKSGYKWILARGRVFVDKKSNTKRMLMMSMDIDKSKRMKKELLDVELLVEDGKIVIFKLNNDKNLSVKYISNSIKTYGYTKQDFENRSLNFIDLIYKDDLNIVIVAIKAALKKDLNDFTFVCRALNAQNEIRWISCRTILIKNHSREVISFYGYINDITKIKVSQEELKIKVEEELEKNRDKDRLLIQQSKLAAMGEMIGSIAHQWRQPLNNVSLILQFLRDNYANDVISIEKIDKYFTRANTQINYMSETIDDFRNFYKPSKSMNEFNIKAAVENSLEIIKPQLKEIDIKLSFNSESFIITNYENELKQSLLNIFNNAKDAIISKKEKTNFDAYLNIDIIKDNNNLKIEISNNGGEIDKDIIGRIFEPYFTTKFETQGTGIGLYMTKIIIETNMSGKIKVYNIKEGAKFIIILPI